MLKFTDQYDAVLPALQSKVAEFHYFQYDTFSTEDLWQYCLKKKWKKKDIGELRIHEMVNDIMEIRASDFVAYNQVEGLRTGSWFTEGNLANLEELLRPSHKK